MLVIVLPSLQFLLGIVQRDELSLLIHSIPHFLDGVISVFGYKGLPLIESGTFCTKTEMTPDQASTRSSESVVGINFQST